MTGAGGSRTAPTGGESRVGLKPNLTGEAADFSGGGQFEGRPDGGESRCGRGLGCYNVDQSAGDVDQLSDGFALGVGLNSRAGQGHLSHFFF